MLSEHAIARLEAARDNAARLARAQQLKATSTDPGVLRIADAMETSARAFVPPTDEELQETKRKSQRLMTSLENLRFSMVGDKLRAALDDLTTELQARRQVLSALGGQEIRLTVGSMRDTMTLRCKAVYARVMGLLALVWDSARILVPALPTHSLRDRAAEDRRYAHEFAVRRQSDQGTSLPRLHVRALVSAPRPGPLAGVAVAA